MCRPRKPGLSCREKGENRLCEGGGREDQGATCGGFGNSWMKGLTCGLLSMGKGWIGMLLWPKLGFMTTTPFVVMGGFWEGLNDTDSHHKTFRVSGHALCVGRNGCGPQKIDVFGVVIRNIMILAPQRAPATNPTYRRDGRQNKISGQHVPSVIPPRQPPAENVGSNNAIPWAHGVRVDFGARVVEKYSL